MVPKFYSMEPHIFIAMILQYNLTLGMVILLAVSVGEGELKKWCSHYEISAENPQKARNKSAIGVSCSTPGIHTKDSESY